jgi:hypothetical protein
MADKNERKADLVFLILRALQSQLSADVFARVEHEVRPLLPPTLTWHGTHSTYAALTTGRYAAVSPLHLEHVVQELCPTAALLGVGSDAVLSEPREREQRLRVALQRVTGRPSLCKYIHVVSHSVWCGGVFLTIGRRMW